MERSGSSAVSEKPDAGAARHTEGHNATDGGISLRGTLPTDRHGMVEFATIVPGWYPGRTEHVHLKVRIWSLSDVNLVHHCSLLWERQACLLSKPSYHAQACLYTGSLPSAGAVAWFSLALGSTAGLLLRDTCPVVVNMGMLYSPTISETAGLTHSCAPQIHVPDPDSDGMTSGLWGDSHLSHTGKLP